MKNTLDIVAIAFAIIATALIYLIVLRHAKKFRKDSDFHRLLSIEKTSCDQLLAKNKDLVDRNMRLTTDIAQRDNLIQAKTLWIVNLRKLISAWRKYGQPRCEGCGRLIKRNELKLVDKTDFYEFWHMGCATKGQVKTKAPLFIPEKTTDHGDAIPYLSGATVGKIVIDEPFIFVPAHYPLPSPSAPTAHGYFGKNPEDPKQPEASCPAAEHLPVDESIEAQLRKAEVGWNVTYRNGKQTTITKIDETRYPIATLLAGGKCWHRADGTCCTGDAYYDIVAVNPPKEVQE